jgi:hypothetical protein
MVLTRDLISVGPLTWWPAVLSRLIMPLQLAVPTCHPSRQLPLSAVHNHATKLVALPLGAAMLLRKTGQAVPAEAAITICWQLNARIASCPVR